MVNAFLVRGFWGPRVESPEEITARWTAFFSHVESSFPELKGSWHDSDNRATGNGDPGEVLARVSGRMAEVPEDERHLGVVLSTASPGSVNGVSAIAAEFTAIAGGSSDSPALKNSAVFKVRPVGAAEFDRVPPEIEATLVALADAWGVDWGDVGTYDLWDAQENDHRVPRRTPRTGLATYLGAGRSRSAMATKGGRRAPGPHGGLVISFLSADGMASPIPELGPIVELDRSLREAEVFQPVPSDRPVF